MPNADQAEEWVDIREAMRITGKTRKTLMLWKKQQAVEAKTEIVEVIQRNRRTFFRKSALLQPDKT
jgi:hypothetical protein